MHFLVLHFLLIFLTQCRVSRFLVLWSILFFLLRLRSRRRRSNLFQRLNELGFLLLLQCRFRTSPCDFFGVCRDNLVLLRACDNLECDVLATGEEDALTDTGIEEEILLTFG